MNIVWNKPRRTTAVVERDRLIVPTTTPHASSPITNGCVTTSARSNALKVTCARQVGRGSLVSKRQVWRSGFEASPSAGKSPS